MGDGRRSSGVCTISGSRRNSDVPLKVRQAETTKIFTSRLLRKKVIDSTDGLENTLRKGLGILDITLLAIAHMVGSGIYVITGSVAKNMAGPAIAVSFVITGFASYLSSLSNAELGVRFPKSGSAYSYIYLALGEVWAFVVGWSMALESCIAAAATARACSSYIDSLTGGVVRNATDAAMGGPVHLFVTSRHLDFVAVGLLVLVTAYQSLGVKLTFYLTNLFSIVNASVIVLIIAAGAYYADVANWGEQAEGFMPFGVSGVLAGSASCFYAFVGCGDIAAVGDETRDPQKSIPRATAIATVIATAGYAGASTVLTLMVNYKDIVDDSGFPEAFSSRGADWVKVTVVSGAVCGMVGAMIGSLHSLTRIVFVMADDGLLFGFCAKVNVRTKMPLGAMYFFAFLSMLLALFMDVTSLVEVMSIGTLFDYIIISSAVIILRYRPKNDRPKLEVHEMTPISESLVIRSTPPDSTGQLKERFGKLKRYIKFCPGALVVYCVIGYVLSTFTLCSFVKVLYFHLSSGAWWAVLITTILSLCVVISFCGILLHHQASPQIRYKVPFVPFLPCFSILINILLVVNLETSSWLRMIIWVSIGLCMYFTYGVEHSKLDVDPDEPYRPRFWSASDTDSSFDARRKAVAALRTKPPLLTTISKEFLFANSDPVS